jgi:hypothetical protein
MGGQMRLFVVVSFYLSIGSALLCTLSGSVVQIELLRMALSLHVAGWKRRYNS